jgi:hypothetical protein
MIELYKIKDPNNELYSAGLTHGYLHKTKRGKTWNSLSTLKSHLVAVEKWDKEVFQQYYDNWLVLKITDNGMEVIGTVKDFK